MDQVKSMHWRTRGGRAARWMLRGLAVLFLALATLEILRMTLVPAPDSVHLSHLNLRPFASIRLYLRYGTLQQQILEIGGGLAIGAVLGFLLPQITPRLRGLIRIELVTSVFIAFVELTQHFVLVHRPLDVDDLILAAIGAAIGYVPLGRMFGMRLHPDHLHWWQRALARVAERRKAERASKESKPAKPAKSAKRATSPTTAPRPQKRTPKAPRPQTRSSRVSR